MRFLWAIFCSFLLVFGMSERLLAYDVRGGTSYIVVDAKTSEILDEKNAYGYKYPASLTKMMTLYVLFSELKRKNLSLESKLQVSNYAASKPASKLYLQPGNTIKVEDAIKALIVKSANDVAVVVAEAIGGSEKEFAKIMTRQARKIGMVRTSFKNASGLHNSKQVSTAFDMYKLALAIQDQFPEYYEYFDLEYFDIYGKRIYGHNKLVKSEKVDGMKTGYTRASGYNIVTNVKYDKKHIIIVVMGSNSSSKRDTLASRLMGQKLQYASQQDRYTQKLYDLAPVSIFGDTTEDGKIVPPKNPFRFPDESSSLDPEKSPDFSFFSNINQNSKSAFVLEQKK